MKRTPLQRKTRLTAKHSNGKPKVPLKKVNVERQAKRRKSYAQKLAAYRRSETYQIVTARAGGGCEAKTMYGRCLSTDRLAHHHLRYQRFGGSELPSDMLVVCHACHERLESEHPTRRHGR